nr:PREDICTED: uncharacterized protein LOC109030490 [Bemisia tabaci]XP_018897021.1 PREDICTED: uncharacterized protein LOC109030490 [Bemisia tabaci]
MELCEAYKILITLADNVKNKDDEMHLKKEVKKQLLPAFTSREESRITEALQCYRAVCNKLRTNNFEWDVLDDIDDLLLSIMENEQNLALRKCYEEILLAVVCDSGLSSLKWSNRLTALFKDYCRVDIGPGSGLNSLKALKAFITNTWPRLKENWGRLTAIVLESLFDLYHSKSITRSAEETDEIRNVCFDSLVILQKAVPDEVNQFIQEILKRDIFNAELNKLLKEVLVSCNEKTEKES